MKCVRCATTLEPDPVRLHWSHCPVCSPEWVEANRHFTHLMRLALFATAAAADPRGKPRIGGVKQ